LILSTYIENPRLPVNQKIYRVLENIKERENLIITEVIDKNENIKGLFKKCKGL
jgi:hypothetical protein